MHFSLFFQDDNNGILPFYQMVYVPCVAWYKNGQELFISKHAGPHFQNGDFMDLINLENIDNSRQVAIIVHEGGHGIERDLNALVDEIKGAGFNWKILA